VCNPGGDSCVSNVSGGHCVTWCYTGTLSGRQIESANATCSCPTATTTPTWF
jgi:hypothetical protein